MISGKVWGTTECLVSTPFAEFHRLLIRPRFQCSLHVHRRKVNAFYVVSGKLFVDVIKGDHQPPDTTELVAGSFMAIPPGEHHRFRTGEQPCECFELYYPEGLSEDIDRRDQGGPVPE